MTNKINVISKLFVITMLTLGFTTFANAATYQFINTSGEVGSVVASSPQEAIATASRLGVHSGVILVTSSTDVNVGNQTTQGQGLHLYQFINTSEQLSSIRADSPQQALAEAYKLGIHSGVIRR